jgi:hypothetical protein
VPGAPIGALKPPFRVAFGLTFGEVGELGFGVLAAPEDRPGAVEPGAAVEPGPVPVAPPLVAPPVLEAPDEADPALPLEDEPPDEPPPDDEAMARVGTESASTR